MSASTEREPLVLEQVAKVLGMQTSDLARETQRAALGLVKAPARPAWCTDGRIVFFKATSVEAAAARRLEERERLRAARAGVLPASWAGFKVIQPEQASQKSSQK